MNGFKVTAAVDFLLEKHGILKRPNCTYYQETDCGGDFNPLDKIHCDECKFHNKCEKGFELIEKLNK